MVTGAGALHALLDHVSKIHTDTMPSACPGLPCPEHLLDGVHKPAGIFQHQPVKGVTLRIAEFSAFEGLQVQSYRSDRGFEFVGNSINKAVVLLVAADLPHQKAGVQDQTGNNGAKEYYPEQDFDAFLPV